MKLHIKWIEINVETEDEALSIIHDIENAISPNYYQWDYELTEGRNEG